MLRQELAGKHCKYTVIRPAKRSFLSFTDFTEPTARMKVWPSVTATRLFNALSQKQGHKQRRLMPKEITGPRGIGFFFK